MKDIFSKQNRALLSELVRTDFKLRYQGSVLGYAWSLLRPLLLFTTLYIIFIRFLKFDFGVPHPQIYLLVGLVAWNFFAEMTSQSLGSIVGRGDLIRKIRIPRWMVVMSSTISALINLGLNLLVIAVFMLVNDVDIRVGAVWLPLLLLEIYVLAAGLSLFLSAAFVKFRDLSFIWEVLLQLAFYATPIIYPMSKITNVAAQKILFMNPMAQTIQDIRYVLVSDQVTTAGKVLGGSPLLYMPYLLPLVFLVFGVYYFKKQAPNFAENL